MKRKKQLKSVEYKNNIHTRNKFRELFHITFTKSVKEEILNLIGSSGCVLVETIDADKSIFVYQIQYRGRKFNIVYNGIKQDIITCMYPGTKYERKGKKIPIYRK